MRKIINKALISALFASYTFAGTITYDVGDKFYVDDNKLIDNTSQPDLYYKNFSGKPVTSIDDVENSNGILEKLYIGWIDFRGADNQNPFIYQNIVNYRGIVSVPCSIFNEIKTRVSNLDADTSRKGIQIKLYTLNSDKGVWIENGKGVFVSSLDVSVPSFNQPIENTNGLITNIGNICNNSDNAYILFEAKDTRYQWVSLGYIYTPSIIKCNVTIKDDSGKGVSTYIDFLSNNECSTYKGTFTNSQGKANLNLPIYCSNYSFKVTYYNPYSGNIEVYDEVYQPSGNCNILITMKDLNKCQVEGIVRDSANNKLSNKMIDIFDNSYKIHKWGYTDSNGKYFINVPCNTDLKLYVDLTYKKTFRVTGKTKITLAPITLQNKDPYFWGYVSVSKIHKSKKLTFSVSGYDVEGDYPLTYKVMLKKGSRIEKNITGNLENFGEIDNLAFDLSNLTEGLYQLWIKGVDKNKNLNNTTKEYKLGEVYIYTKNLPPIIKDFSLSKTALLRPEVISVYAYIEDLEGDNLSGSLAVKCFDKSKNLLSSKSYNDIIPLFKGKTINVDLKSFPKINNADFCNFDLSISDGINRTSEYRELTFYNDPPTVNIWGDTNTVQRGENLKINSYVADDLGISECNWYINGRFYSKGCDPLTINTSNYTAGDFINIKLEAIDVKGLISSKTIEILVQ